MESLYFLEDKEAQPHLSLGPNVITKTDLFLVSRKIATAGAKNIVIYEVSNFFIWEIIKLKFWYG